MGAKEQTMFLKTLTNSNKMSKRERNEKLERVVNLQEP
jgi:hypothetical protein